MRTKDFILMEKAYLSVFESKSQPCPCTLGKKCKKKNCPCPECKKSMVKENEEVPNRLSDPQMQEALAILQQYAQGDITNVQAAEEFEKLYKNGPGQGPTQDDQFYTKLQ